MKHTYLLIAALPSTSLTERIPEVSVKGAIVNVVNSGVSGSNVTKIVDNVEKFIMVKRSKSELRYCNSFPNGSATK